MTLFHEVNYGNILFKIPKEPGSSSEIYYQFCECVCPSIPSLRMQHSICLSHSIVNAVIMNSAVHYNGALLKTNILDQNWLLLVKCHVRNEVGGHPPSLFPCHWQHQLDDLANIWIDVNNSAIDSEVIGVLLEDICEKRADCVRYYLYRRLISVRIHTQGHAVA
jgi:hypothetical protein